MECLQQLWLREHPANSFKGVVHFFSRIVAPKRKPQARSLRIVKFERAQHVGAQGRAA